MIIAALATEIPPVLVADALGYKAETVIGHAADAGDTRTRYTAGKTTPT